MKHRLNSDFPINSAEKVEKMIRFATIGALTTTTNQNPREWIRWMAAQKIQGGSELMDASFPDVLKDLTIIRSEKSRSISAENPTGSKGQGGKNASQLGVGRKGRPCITVKQGETSVLADIDGPGYISSIWVTVPEKTSDGLFTLRNLVLRMYWDDESVPSVEVPLGDFFCNGFGRYCEVNSYPIVVNPTGGMNCYFKMPFRKRAQITITNEHAGDIGGFFYQINYSLVDDVPTHSAYFHARWNREKVTSIGKDYVILDNVHGQGHYIGTYIGIARLERWWYGEGEVKVYLDGDKEWPTICYTGLEDYFGGAWGFREMEKSTVQYKQYSTPFLGHPFYSKSDHTLTDEWGTDAVPMDGLYRWHILDPIRFESNFKVTIQQIGLNEHGLVERADDMTSVAYWYQCEPHTPFAPILPAKDRVPR